MFDRHTRLTSPSRCGCAERPPRAAVQIIPPHQISAHHTVQAARRALRDGLPGVAVIGGHQVELGPVRSGPEGEVLALAPPGVVFRPLPGCTDAPGDLWLTWEQDAYAGEIWLAGWWRQVEPTALPTTLVDAARTGASAVLALEVAEGLIRMSHPGSRTVAVPVDDESVRSLTGPGPDGH